MFYERAFHFLGNATDAEDAVQKALLSACQQLRDIDGLTTKEAALALDVAEGTVKAQLARARAKLAGILKIMPTRRQSRRSPPGRRALL
jgi:DNA-directed RNA polymerase specialized sigma24 family protein